MKIASERVPIDFIVDMFKDYPDEEVAGVFNFIDEVGIEDLHGSNCGYNKDGLVVFTDYSGYHDWFIDKLEKFLYNMFVK